MFQCVSTSNAQEPLLKTVRVDILRSRYHIFDTCPHLYSEIGNANPGYLPPGSIPYFDRTDVQQAINAPVGFNWERCSSDPVFAGPTYEDQSPGPALDGTLTNVIDKTQNVIIGSGALDFLLETNGTLFALQNTTWGGVQGFQTRPSTPFYVPYRKCHSTSPG